MKTSGVNFQIYVMLFVILVVLQLVTIDLCVDIGWWKKRGSICIDGCTMWVIIESRD